MVSTKFGAKLPSSKWSDVGSNQRSIHRKTAVAAIFFTVFGVLHIAGSSSSRAEAEVQHGSKFLERFRTYFEMMTGPSDFYEFSRSMEPVNLRFERKQLESINFEIPRAYLITKTGHRGGVQQSTIRIRAVLPSMKPWMLASSEERGRISAQKVDSNAIDIHINPYGKGYSVEKRLNNHRNFFKIGKQYIIKYGLRSYSNETNPNYKIKSLEKEAFTLNKNVETNYFYMACTIPINRKMENQIICGAYIVSKEGLGIYYTFKRIHLPKWRAVDAAVRHLVEKFIARSAVTNGSAIR